MKKKIKKDLMTLLGSLEALVKKLPSYNKGDKEVVVVLEKFFILVSTFRENQKEVLSELEGINGLLSLLKFEEANLFSHPLTGIKYNDDVTITLLFENRKMTIVEFMDGVKEQASLRKEWNESDRSKMSKKKEDGFEKEITELDEEIHDMVNGVKIFIMNFTNNLATKIHNQEPKTSIKDRIRNLRKRI